MRKRVKNNSLASTDEENVNRLIKTPESNLCENNCKSFHFHIKICFFCNLVIFLIYFLTLHPSIAGGDSGELILSSHELGVAHPPGYPLFTLLGKLFITFLPVYNVAWRVNVLSALCSAMSSFFLQMCILRITQCVGTSLLVFAFFSLNNLTWTWSTCAEVFALNNLFCASIFFVMLYIDSIEVEGDNDAVDNNKSIKENKFDGSSSLKNHLPKIYILTFLCGLSLTNQHTIVVYVMFIAAWVICKLYLANLLTKNILTKLFMITIISLSPYVHLPIASCVNCSRWTWGDEGSLMGFLTHVLRREYGTFDLSKGTTGSGFQTLLQLYLHHLQHHMCELCPWLALIGLVTSLSWFYMNKFKSLLLIFLMSCCYVCFFCWRANLDVTNPLFIGVVERFWMQADIGFVILACVGYNTAIRLVVEKFFGLSKITMTSVFTMMGSLILITLQLQFNMTKCNNSNNYVVHDFARTILKSVPRNALILTRGDLSSLSLKYFHICENIRQDIDVVDVAILSYEWSLRVYKKFNPKVVFPGDFWRLQNAEYENGKHSFNFKTFLDENINNRPIFTCIGMQDKDQSWTPHYKQWPYGVCHIIQPTSSRLDPKVWANKTGGIADKWSYKFDDFDKKSWERVANDEMWHAKIGTAFFLYQLALQTDDINYKADLLVQSYELYFRAIKIHQHPSRMTHVETFPSFWHKNFALVCEKLLHVNIPPHLDKVKLCKSSLFHFEQYLHITPDDQEAPSIRQAIQVLKQRLDIMNNFKKAEETLERTAARLEKLDEIAEKIRNATTLAV